MNININTGEAVIKGKKFYLTKNEVYLLAELNKPGIRTYVDLYNAVYKTNVNELFPSEVRKINVQIYRLKEKTKIKLIGRRQFGYELIKGENE